MTRSDGFSMPARAALIQLKSSLTNPRPMSGQYTARTNAPHAIIKPIRRTLSAGDIPATAVARDSVLATRGMIAEKKAHERARTGLRARTKSELRLRNGRLTRHAPPGPSLRP